jgi:RNA polymerase sigma-70 factor (ECF subfamily)
LAHLTVKDDLLRMMFSCCHPRLPEEAQVALVLHILCGFSVTEIAAAFLSTDAATQKRISRAKKVLAGSRRLFDLADADFVARPFGRSPRVISALQRRLPRSIRRIGRTDRAVPRGHAPRDAARRASLHSDPGDARARGTHAPPRGAPARARGCVGEPELAVRIQDRSQWDPELIAEGQRLLDLSATGSALTEYHVEAAIASVHASAPRAEDTNWGQIVALYDTLMAFRASPVVALNRAIAVAQRDGPERGLQEIHAIAGRNAWPGIRSTSPRSASSSFGATGMRSPGAFSRRAHARAQRDGTTLPADARARLRTLPSVRPACPP